MLKNLHNTVNLGNLASYSYYFGDKYPIIIGSCVFPLSLYIKEKIFFFGYHPVHPHHILLCMATIQSCSLHFAHKSNKSNFMNS